MRMCKIFTTDEERGVSVVAIKVLGDNGDDDSALPGGTSSQLVLSGPGISPGR